MEWDIGKEIVITVRQEIREYVSLAIEEGGKKLCNFAEQLVQNVIMVRQEERERVLLSTEEGRNEFANFAEQLIENVCSGSLMGCEERDIDFGKVGVKIVGNCGRICPICGRIHLK